MRDEQIARAQQQIDEIERASAALQALVSGDAPASSPSQQRREIAVGRALEGVELGGQRFVARPSTASRSMPLP